MSVRMTPETRAMQRLVDFYDRRQVNKVADLAVEILNNEGLVVAPWGIPGRRRVFAMLGAADNAEVARKINRAKGRPEGQVLSISIIPEAISDVVIPDSSAVLMRASERFHRKPEHVLGEIFRGMPMGFFLEAQPRLGNWVTDLNNERRVVYIGGGDTDHPQNFYSIVYERFYRKYNRLLIATSANRTGEDTHPVFEYGQVCEELGDSIDLVVIDNNPSVHPIPALRHFASPTMVNLLEDPAQLIRRGSRHERVLEHYFGRIIVPDNVKIYANSEKEWEVKLGLTVSLDRLDKLLTRAT